MRRWSGDNRGSLCSFRRLCALIVIVAGLAGSLVSGAEPYAVCAACGKPITGRTVLFEGQTFHPQCFVCAGCRQPITDTYTIEDHQPYHKECYIQRFAVRCGFCGKPITGPFIVSEGRQYHEDCFRDHVAPRCAICNEPITGKYVEHDNKRYHPKCFEDHAAARCALCERPILGSYYENDWGQRIHKEHGQKEWLCDGCGRYAKPAESYRLADGRLQCNQCSLEAVNTSADARELLARAAGILKAKGIYIQRPLEQIQIEMVNKIQLKQKSEEKGPGDPHGLTVYQRRKIAGITVKTRVTIYFLDELPKDAFLGVAAHELFHVWQNERNAVGGDTAWIEGSANVAAHLVLETVDSDLARHEIRRMEQNEDPRYGAGYLRALDTYRKQGVLAYLDEVQRRCSKPR